MAACCKREGNEPQSTCCPSESGVRDGVENDVKVAPQEADTDERCSGEICDGMTCQRQLHVQTNTDALVAEMCIQAAAALECRAACDQESKQSKCTFASNQRARATSD